MPIYDYQCRACGHRFECFVRSNSPAPECPACQKQDLEQLISLCAVSSDTTREANLSAAHKKAASVRKGRQIDEHKQHHDHFQDNPSTPKPRKPSPK